MDLLESIASAVVYISPVLTILAAFGIGIQYYHFKGQNETLKERIAYLKDREKDQNETLKNTIKYLETAKDLLQNEKSNLDVRISELNGEIQGYELKIIELKEKIKHDEKNRARYEKAIIEHKKVIQKYKAVVGKLVENNRNLSTVISLQEKHLENVVQKQKIPRDKLAQVPGMSLDAGLEESSERRKRPANLVRNPNFLKSERFIFKDSLELFYDYSRRISKQPYDDFTKKMLNDVFNEFVQVKVNQNGKANSGPVNMHPTASALQRKVISLLKHLENKRRRDAMTETEILKVGNNLQVILLSYLTLVKEDHEKLLLPIFQALKFGSTHPIEFISTLNYLRIVDEISPSQHLSIIDNLAGLGNSAEELEKNSSPAG